MKILINILFLLIPCKVVSQQINTYFLDKNLLLNQKVLLKKGDAKVTDAVKRLLQQADGHLNDRPNSVMEKSITPPSGSKHDYMSIAPYWWPDSSKSAGLPYIRKDGKTNPEVYTISDRFYLRDLEDKCKLLSLAYFFTDNKKYGNKAAALLKIWFIDSATRMNANLNYGQAIRGINDGRGISIIETRVLVPLVDWIGLLNAGGALTNTDLSQIKNWYSDYSKWLRTSKNGKDEKGEKNNHGTYYDLQLITYSLFVGDSLQAKEELKSAKNRIVEQIDSSGSQPMELERADPYGYSLLNLNGWFNIALLGDQLGIDLWNFKTQDGRSIQKALDWFTPYALSEKKDEEKPGYR